MKTTTPQLGSARPVSTSAGPPSAAMTRRRFVALGSAGFAAAESVASDGPSTSQTDRQHPFCLDAQSHLFVPVLLERMKRRTTEPFVIQQDGHLVVRMPPWDRKVLPKHTDVKAKLADMDANGIAMTALSVNDPGPEWFGADGLEVARVMNDFVADIVRRHPQRFIGLCVLPWQDMKAARVELERCVRDLGILVRHRLAVAGGDAFRL